MAERTESVGTGAPEAGVSSPAVPNPWPANASFRGRRAVDRGTERRGARSAIRHAVAGVRSIGSGRPAPRGGSRVPEDVLRREGVLGARDAQAGRGRGARPPRGERRRGRSVRARRGRPRADRAPRTQQVRRGAGAGDPGTRGARDRRRPRRAPSPGRVGGGGRRRAAVPPQGEPRRSRRHARVHRHRPRVDGVRGAGGRRARDGRGRGLVRATSASSVCTRTSARRSPTRNRSCASSTSWWR